LNFEHQPDERERDDVTRRALLPDGARARLLKEDERASMKQASGQPKSTAELAAAFERERAHLWTVAMRTLGSDYDADDAVQETWLRLNRTGGEGIANLRAWLTTVTSRVCLDMLRTGRIRREVPVEIDLDELVACARPTGAEPSAATPEEEVLLAESVGLALHVVMDSMTPTERVAFVLHDIFDVPFGQIADVLGRSTDAVKMLASRARRRVRVVPETAGAGEPDDRSVVDAFFAAAGAGDLSALLALLAPDAELRTFSADGVTVVHGSAKIAAQAGSARAGAAAGAVLRPITVRGDAGVLISVDDRPITMLAFTIRGRLVTQIRSVVDPDRLLQIIPSWAL
jgi:RNA polymerase sigma-70 factor (ECF subfamily)